MGPDQVRIAVVVLAGIAAVVLVGIAAVVLAGMVGRSWDNPDQAVWGGSGW